jgi:hypothetical protein
VPDRSLSPPKFMAEARFDLVRSVRVEESL